MAIPRRLRYMASASVLVVPRETSTANGIFSASAVSWRSSKTAGWMDGPRDSVGPLAEDDLPLVLRLPAADVVRMRDVDRERDLRLGGEGGGPGSREVADLFLHGGNGDEIARARRPAPPAACAASRAT